MSVNRYIRRPAVTHTVQWDGTNIEEIQALTSYPLIDESGTLEWSSGSANVGQWLVINGPAESPGAYDTDPINDSLQSVNNEGPFDYTVTEVS